MHVLSCIMMDEMGISSCHFLMYLQFMCILCLAAGNLYWTDLHTGALHKLTNRQPCKLHEQTNKSISCEKRCWETEHA